jgi:L-cysteine/cystine lyase
MTHDEARAQFPVLERYAYLNAGSAGPLPRAAVDATRARLERDLTEGRSGRENMEEIFELRERVRGGIAAVLGTSAELVALTESTTRG